MDERDRRAFGPGSRGLIDQPDAAALKVFHRRVDIVDAQGDVMQARPALVHVLRDRRIGGGRLEQFEVRLPDVDELRTDALRRHLLGCFDLEAKRVAIERECGRQILHRDTDMVQGRLHEFKDLRI